jgi:hypothetical protein
MITTRRALAASHIPVIDPRPGKARTEPPFGTAIAIRSLAADRAPIWMFWP